MPAFKKLEADYRTMLVRVGLDVTYADEIPPDKAREAINLDIPRISLVDFHGNTIQSHRDTWTQENVSHAYSQGNDTAAIFGLCISLRIFLPDNYPKFAEKYLSSTNTQDNLQKNFYIFRFAYYNDQEIPCGFSLAYSTKDPSLWTAAIITNTPVAPTDRTVTFFCPDDVIQDPGDKKLTKRNVLPEILQSLNSASIKKLLGNILTQDGTVNLDALQQLELRVIGGQNIDNRDVKQGELNALINSIEIDRLPNQRLKSFFANLKKQAKEDINFYQEENYLKVTASITQVAAFINNIDCFKQTLDAFPKNTHDEIKFHQTGVALLNNITHIIGSDLSALTTKDLSILNEVVKTATNALTNPNDAKTIKKLGELTQTVSGKSSWFWKGLGASLLAFTGAALVVAGVLGAIPTGGVSLILVAAGAAALAVAGGASVAKGREHGFAKSISMFKTHLPKGTTPQHKDQPASKDEDLKDDNKSKDSFDF